MLAGSHEGSPELASTILFVAACCSDWLEFRSLINSFLLLPDQPAFGLCTFWTVPTLWDVNSVDFRFHCCSFCWDRFQFNYLITLITSMIVFWLTWIHSFWNISACRIILTF
jgi:hypothetical protein